MSRHWAPKALLLMLVAACSAIHRGVTAQTCAADTDCPGVLNAINVTCINSSCKATCQSGFRQAGVVCVKARTLCSRGRQPSGNRCVTCPPNTYKETVGNTTCSKCPDGTFTAGRLAKDLSSRSKCLPGGLSNAGDRPRPPKLPAFRAQYAEAVLYMKATSAAMQSEEGTPCPDCTAAAAAQLSKGAAYIAGSPLDFSSDQERLRMPPRRPRVQHQGQCATCVNAAMTAATEAAAATAAGSAGSSFQLSPLYGYYCQKALERSCGTGWTFEEALKGLSSSVTRYMPDISCTQGYDLEKIRSVTPGQLKAACSDIQNKCPKATQLERCSYQALSDFWEIQRAIRVQGAVLTRVSIRANFIEFFEASRSGVYTSNTTQPGAFPHAIILVGYNNTGQYWIAQNSYGTGFGDGGVFRVAYGVADVANPSETFAIRCTLPGSTVANPALKWPLRPLPNAAGNTNTSCYSYTAQKGDYLAGISEHFGVNIRALVSRNLARGVFDMLQGSRPDLTTPLEGKELLVCGITEDLGRTAALECPPGESQVGSSCTVCPDDTYKATTGTASCQACPAGSVTTGCEATDHDSNADCKPAPEQLMCEQFMGENAKSGVYNVTLRCRQYQVYCDMETDGGGWLLGLSYNVAGYVDGGPAVPDSTFVRTLADGFPILSNNPLGVDESNSTGVGGSWGHMLASALAQVPNIGEVLAVFQMLNPLKLAEGVEEVLTSRYKTNDPETITYMLTSERAGVNINNIRHSFTPMAGHNFFIPSDGLGGFSPDNLWLLARFGFPVRHAVYVRGKSKEPQSCPPGLYAVGMTCHICPDHMFKAELGPGPCTPCPKGTVAASRDLNVRSSDYHDSAGDCKPGVPDVVWNITRPDGSKWAWDFFWSIRAQPGHAEDICQQRGGHLVTVDSVQTATLLAEKVNGDDTGRLPFPLLHYLTIMWMGLHSETPNDTREGWKWYSGAPYRYGESYTNWITDNPDNYQGLQGRHAAFLLDNTYMWDDYNNNFYQEFLCERKLGG